MSYIKYGRNDYWDKRYTQDGQTFDWYGRLFDFQDILL